MAHSNQAKKRVRQNHKSEEQNRTLEVVYLGQFAVYIKQLTTKMKKPKN